MRVGVLASGSGTILESILEYGIPVEVVVADRQCRALEIAESANVAAELVVRESFGKRFDRAAYSQRVVDVLHKYEVELVVSAGFATVVPGVATAFPNRALNTHPALLPAFKGWHAVREALDAAVPETGCTVHILTEEMDAGPIIAQETVRVLPDDTEETLHERIKEVERRLYPVVIKKIMDGEIEI